MLMFVVECFIQRNADQFYNAMSDIKGLKPVMPAGAMYMMVSKSRQRQLCNLLSGSVNSVSARSTITKVHHSEG